MSKKKLVAMVLTFVMCVLCVNTGMDAKAKKATLATKNVTLTVGKTKTVKIKNKAKKAKYSYKTSNKKKVTVSKAGKMKAKAVGSAKVTVTEKIGKKSRKVGVVKVKVVAKKTEGVDETPVATEAPTTVPTTAPTVAPTAAPTIEPTPAPDDYTTPSGFDTKQTGVTYGTQTKETYYSTTTGKDRKFWLILPNGYTEAKKYPVLYLLHGIGGDESEWLGGNPRYVIGNLIAKGWAKEMIVVIPNVRAREDDSGNPSDIFTKEHYAAFDNFINDLRDNLMPYMAKNYSIATGRENTAIAGLSMGGRESLNIGLKMADTFGYIGAFSPAYGLLPYTNNSVTEEGLFTEDTLKLPDEYNGKTLLMIVNGKSDSVVYSEPEKYHNALTKNGTDHTYYLTAGGHDFTVWKNGLYNFARRIF